MREDQREKEHAPTLQSKHEHSGECGHAKDERTGQMMPMATMKAKKTAMSFRFFIEVASESLRTTQMAMTSETGAFLLPGCDEGQVERCGLGLLAEG